MDTTLTSVDTFGNGRAFCLERAQRPACTARKDRLLDRVSRVQSTRSDPD